MMNTMIPKIICSNHSYGVRPLARFRNTSSSNTEPPFLPSDGGRVWSEQPMCHACPMVQNCKPMEVENGEDLFEAAGGAGAGLFAGGRQRRRKGRLAGGPGRGRGCVRQLAHRRFRRPGARGVRAIGK